MGLKIEIYKQKLQNEILFPLGIFSTDMLLCKASKWLAFQSNHQEGVW